MSDIKNISSISAPQPIGPYSQAVYAGNFLFCSGQIGIDPKSGVLVSSGIAAETKRAFENIISILQEANLSLQDVVRVDVYITRMSDFSIVNEIYAQIFKNHSPFPARITVGVSELPKNASIEISCIAIKNK